MTKNLTNTEALKFESNGHYEESMRDFTRVLDYLDRAENISEERKELYHRSLDEIGMDGVFELARNTNELFKELGINSFRLQLVEHGRKSGMIGGMIGGRKGRGRGFWQTHPELLEDIAEFREESFNHSSKFSPNSPSWDYVTAKMNEKYNEDWKTYQLEEVYRRNKHLLSDEEE